MFSDTFLLLGAILLPAALARVVVDPVHNTCGANSQQGGDALMSDVTNMGSSALGLMQKAEAGQLSNWDRYTVMATFNAFFDGESADAQSRWDTVKTNLGTMANLGTTSPNVYVTCNDRTLWVEDAGPPVTYNFSNPVTGQTNTGFQPNLVKRCQDGVTQPDGSIAYQIAYRIQIQGVEYISLCLQQNSGDHLLSQQSYKPGDNLDDKNTLSTTLFHEMTHAAIPSMVGDSAGGTAVGGERYGWGGAQQVRTTYAVRNPDSLTLFSMALSFDPYLWFTGVASTTQSEFSRLQQQSPNVIQNFGLTQP